MFTSGSANQNLSNFEFISFSLLIERVDKMAKSGGDAGGEARGGDTVGGERRDALGARAAVHAPRVKVDVVRVEVVPEGYSQILRLQEILRIQERRVRRTRRCGSAAAAGGAGAARR